MRCIVIICVYVCVCCLCLHCELFYSNIFNDEAVRQTWVRYSSNKSLLFFVTVQYFCKTCFQIRILVKQYMFFTPLISIDMSSFPDYSLFYAVFVYDIVVCSVCVSAVALITQHNQRLCMLTCCYSTFISTISQAPIR